MHLIQYWKKQHISKYTVLHWLYIIPFHNNGAVWCKNAKI